MCGLIRVFAVVMSNMTVGAASDVPSPHEDPLRLTRPGVRRRVERRAALDRADLDRVARVEPLPPLPLRVEVLWVVAPRFEVLARIEFDDRHAFAVCAY